MKRVSELTFPASVATFDDPAHPEGVELASTEPLRAGAPFTAIVRFPSGPFAWLSSTAVWGRDGHPWALVRRFHFDGDAMADPPTRPGDGRLVGGRELTITDDLAAGRANFASGGSVLRPARVHATAWVGLPGAGPSVTVVVDDGVSPADPATITVLSGDALASGLALRAEPGLATRLLATAASITAPVAPLAADLPPRLRRAVPSQLTIIARPSQ